MSRRKGTLGLVITCLGMLQGTVIPGLRTGIARADGQESAPAATPVAGHRNPMLHQTGMKIVDAQGHEVRLHSVSLGGWLIWEGWIFGKGIVTPQSTMTSRLEKAVGADETERFRYHIYDAFITEADIARISQTGFNCVRVPFPYFLFDDDRGWKLLDRVLDWCDRCHLYAVLDLQMVPGSTLGMLEPKPIWSSEETLKKAVGLWRAMALRYGKRTTVAGPPEINGWSFWTWKRAPSTYPGLVTIKVPKDWATVMDWLSSLLGTNQPSADTVRTGMRDFLEAVDLKNCDMDPQMKRILMANRG